MKKNYLIPVGTLFSVIIILSILVPLLIPDTDIIFTQDTSSRTDPEKTLRSLKKIDSTYPFYIMKYYGDYGFQDVLEYGTYTPSNSEIGNGWACTCFSALNSTANPYFGRNFDWMQQGALFLYTEPSYGYASISTVNLGILGLNPSFDSDDPTIRERLLLSPYYLMDGMNEMGLAVGIMAVNRASRTYNASQSTISCLDIVRLALEFASCVDEALLLWENYNIDFFGVPIHYMVSDSRKSAIVEWIDGNMHIYPNEVPWQVSTNFIFTDGITDCWRYQTATQILQNKEGSITMGEGMNILQACSQGITLWSNIYDLAQKSVYISVYTEYQKIYEFQF